MLLGEKEIGALLPLKDKWWERNRFLPSGKSNSEQFAQDEGEKAQWQCRDREACSEEIQESASFYHIHERSRES